MKKIISLLLTLAMVFTMAIPAFAADTAKSAIDYDGDPVIVVRGIEFAGLTYSDGTKALQFDAKGIIETVLSYILARVTGNKDAFADKLIAYMQKTFAPIATDKNGNSVRSDVGMKGYPLSIGNYKEESASWEKNAICLASTLGDTIGGDNAYLFNFDWRKSPFILADELKAFIDNVKAETKKDNVHIVACSMGGMVTAAYLYEYGYEGIDTLVFNSSAHNGTHLVGYAMMGEISISGDMLNQFIISIADNQNFFLKAILKILGTTGIYDRLADFVDDYIKNNKRRIYDEFLRDYVATSLGLWGMCPDEYFDKGVEFIFGNNKSEYAATIANLQEIKEFVCSTEEILAGIQPAGVNLAFAANYDGAPLPLYEKSTMQTDGIIEGERCSNGAYFAPVGQTLSAEYLSAADPKYISPDKIVDTSTAAYRDITWIVKDAGHVGCKAGSDHINFVMWLATRDEQTYIYSDSNYPQFLVCDTNMNFIR